MPAVIVLLTQFKYGRKVCAYQHVSNLYKNNANEQLGNFAI